MSDSHFTLGIDLVAKQQQFLGNWVGTLWLREESKEALASVLNHFGYAVQLLLVGLLTFTRGMKWGTLRKQPCITGCPLTRTQQATPGTFLALTLSGRKVFCWQPRTGIKHRASPRLVPGCLTRGREVPQQQ